MKKVIFVLVCTMVIFFSANTVYAANVVSVQVPDFSVVLNDNPYDNQHAKYPLLVYQDVTYFPMTYQLTRSLGLATGWDQKKGLYIVQHTEYTDVAAEMGGNNKLGGVYKATIPTYPVWVNGWQVDNSKEQYPLLNFRDVTYFPLSWHYVHDEFGWNIVWNKATGLQVDNYIQHSGSDSIALVQMEQDAAILQNCKTYQRITEHADGSIGYSWDKAGYYNYRLDFAADTLQDIGEGQEEIAWENAPSEDVSSALTLKGRQLLYNDREILEELPEAYTQSPGIYSVNRYESTNANMLAVYLYYNSEIPAPYTPHVQYVFLEKDGTVQQVKQWNEMDYPSSFYETTDGYYICSYGRLVAGRFSNGLHTIIKVDKTSSKETVLNDLYSQYRSLEAIGAADDKLYVRATYFGQEEDLTKLEYAEKVKPEQDGYFYIDPQMKLHKVHDYIDGEVFLAPNGKLYVYDTWRLQVTNLTDHIKLSLMK